MYFVYVSGIDYLTAGCVSKDVNDVLWVDTNACAVGSGTFSYYGYS